MKIDRTFLGTTALVAILLISPLSFAQRGIGGPGGRGTGQRLYDTTTVQTVRGEVTGVDRYAGAHGIGAGIHATLKSDSGSVSVHLGPSWYLDKQSVKIEKGDKITVTGSRIILQGKSDLVAAEVKKGDKTLSLRDKQGYPLWSRRQR
jgi:hypothetical protein